MLSGRSIAAIGLASTLAAVGGAQAFDGPKYPDWKGQWTGSFSREIPARRQRVGTRPNLGDWDNKRR